MKRDSEEERYPAVHRGKEQAVLTEAERQEIEKEIRNYMYPRAGCLDALKIIQKHHGWVADEHLADLAPLLGMTADEVEGVATFYPFVFRRPVGRHIIYVCDSFVCWAMGYEAVFQALINYLGVSWGDTTVDGRFTLLPAACLGQCDKAPAIMVDRDLHGDVSPEKIEAILKRYV